MHLSASMSYTWRPWQNGHHLADNIFRIIFLYENCWIFIQISLMFIPKGLINNKHILVEIMAWYRTDDKLLSELVMAYYTNAYMSLDLYELSHCGLVIPHGHLPHFELLCTITHHPFKLGSPNLDQRCKIPWSRSLLFEGAIVRDLQGQVKLKSWNFIMPSFNTRVNTFATRENT